MIIVLKQGTTQQEIDTVTNAVVARGVSVSPIVGTEMTILGLTGDTSRIDPDQLESFHCVERIMKVAEPFKKANRAFHPAPSEIKIGNTVVGGKKLAIMAGPCSVESNEQITAVAQAVKDAGATEEMLAELYVNENYCLMYTPGDTVLALYAFLDDETVLAVTFQVASKEVGDALENMPLEIFGSLAAAE